MAIIIVLSPLGAGVLPRYLPEGKTKSLTTRPFDRAIFSFGAAALGDTGLSSAPAWNQVRRASAEKNFVS